LLLFAGWQMASVCKDMKTVSDLASLAVVTSACLVLGVAAGFAAGFAAVLVINRLTARSGIHANSDNHATATANPEERNCSIPAK